MNLAAPFSDVVPGPRGRLLHMLVELEAPATVRALARHAGVSPQAALTLVNELSEAGVVRAERAGSALMVTLNREHLAAAPLVDLVQLRRRFIERLGAEVRKFPDLSGAWLVGSAVRGDGGRDSDIDLVLVAATTIAPAWAAAARRLDVAVRTWTGNHLHLIEYTNSAFAALVDGRNPLIDSLRVDGVALTPDSPALLRCTS